MEAVSSSKFRGLERSDSDVSLASVTSMASVVSVANTASGSTLDCQREEVMMLCDGRRIILFCLMVSRIVVLDGLGKYTTSLSV